MPVMAVAVPRSPPSLTLYCKHNRLSFACVKIMKQLSDAVLVLRKCDHPPRDAVNIDRWDNIFLGGQFRGHCWRNEYLPMQRGKNFEAASIP